MDELEQRLNNIERLKKSILDELKGRKKQWQDLCNLLEKGTIYPGLPFGSIPDDNFPPIPYRRRLKNTRTIEFIYVQIVFVLMMIKDRKVEKRKRTIAEKYWREREKMEWRFWKEGKDPKLVEKMVCFANVPKDYPFPYYPPSRNHMKQIEIVKRHPGRPVKDLRYFLGETIDEPLRELSSPSSLSNFRIFRTLVLEKLFKLLFS